MLQSAGDRDLAEDRSGPGAPELGGQEPQSHRPIVPQVVRGRRHAVPSELSFQPETGGEIWRHVQRC